MSGSAFWLALALFLALLFNLLRLHRGLRHVGWLARLPDDALPAAPPRVSVIFSALDEAATLEPALRSMLALDYPGLEVIAINDRSTDGTGAILDRLAREHPRLRVLHLDALPDGWLGKNHALHRGAGLADGDYLLFTDADVRFEPHALRRAVAHCERQALDHLAVLPDIVVRQPLLAAVLLNFYAFMFELHPPWKARIASSPVYVGVGAFNLVRAAAYRQAGGHAALRLEVVDDLMLGRLLKRHGLRQDALLGNGAVAVEWYRSAGELMRGLEKNSLAAADYHLPRLAAGTAAILLLRYGPLAGLFAASGAAWWCCAGAVAATLLAHLRVLGLTSWSRRCLWWWPVSAALLLFFIWRGVALTLRRGGVLWRGTLYRLDALRQAHQR